MVPAPTLPRLPINIMQTAKDMMTIDISNITFTVENSMPDARDIASIAPSPASGIIFAGT